MVKLKLLRIILFLKANVLPNPVLKSKCATIEETKGVSIALKILKTLENVKFLKQISSWITQEDLIY